LDDVSFDRKTVTFQDIRVRGLDGLGRERRRLSALYVGALEQLASQSESSGDARGGARWGERVAAEPYSSRIARALLESLIAIGEPEAAVHAGLACGERVRRDLGMEPDPEIASLVTALTRTRPERTGPASLAEPITGAHAPRDPGLRPAGEPLRECGSRARVSLSAQASR